jgi:hypothetical protein
MKLRGGAIGVIVYVNPSISSSGRRKVVGYSPKIEELKKALLFEGSKTMRA